MKADPLCVGYTVDVGARIASFIRYGIDSILEFELGERTHNHQKVSALSYQTSQGGVRFDHPSDGQDWHSAPFGANRPIRHGRPDKSVATLGLLNAPKPI